MKVELRTSRGVWDARDPESYNYSIKEIARSQSRMTRFCGHTLEKYYLAEHSVSVAKLVMRVVKLPAGVTRTTLGICGLLHDAAEVFVGDMPGPVKALPEMAGYRALDDRTQRAILRAFGIWLPAETRAEVDAIVDLADKEMCRKELAGLYAPGLTPWTSSRSYEQFMTLAGELGLAARRAEPGA